MRAEGNTVLRHPGISISLLPADDRSSFDHLHRNGIRQFNIYLCSSQLRKLKSKAFFQFRGDEQEGGLPGDVQRLVDLCARENLITDHLWLRGA